MEITKDGYSREEPSIPVVRDTTSDAIPRPLAHELPPDKGDCAIAGCHVPAWCRLRPWCDEEVAKRGGRDAETVAAIARRLAKGGEVMDWIACTERMPELYTRVLAYVVAPGRYSDGADDAQTTIVARREQHTDGSLQSYWWATADQEWPDFRVSHWMPLPEPPLVDYAKDKQPAPESR